MTDLLLDTHILLWWQADDPALSKKARRLIADADRRVVVSALSLWEIAIKSGRGKLTADARLVRDAILDDGFELLGFSASHALEVAALPAIHNDPFDRGLIATARADGLSLVTSDELLKGYGAGVMMV